MHTVVNSSYLMHTDGFLIFGSVSKTCRKLAVSCWSHAGIDGHSVSQTNTEIAYSYTNNLQASFLSLKVPNDQLALTFPVLFSLCPVTLTASRQDSNVNVHMSKSQRCCKANNGFCWSSAGVNNIFGHSQLLFMSFNEALHWRHLPAYLFHVCLRVKTSKP